MRKYLIKDMMQQRGYETYDDIAKASQGLLTASVINNQMNNRSNPDMKQCVGWIKAFDLSIDQFITIFYDQSVAKR